MALSVTPHVLSSQLYYKWLEVGHNYKPYDNDSTKYFVDILDLFTENSGTRKHESWFQT